MAASRRRRREPGAPAWLLLVLMASLWTSEAAVSPNRSVSRDTAMVWSEYPVVIVETSGREVRYDPYPECDNNQYQEENGTCYDCVSYGNECMFDLQCSCIEFLKCKYSSERNKDRMYCLCDQNWTWENNKCTSPTPDNSAQFMVAAQVALGAALVIAISALSALTCKMCSSRRQLEEARRRDSGASSLNSVQRFVLSRLRDRPPRYDDVPAVPDKPPAYDEMAASTAELPLPRPPVAAAMPHPLLARTSRRPAHPPAYNDVISAVPSTSLAPVHQMVPSTPDQVPSTVEDYETSATIAPVLEPIASFPNETDDLPMTLRDSGEPEYIQVIQLEVIQPGTSENSGVDNPAFTPECHI